MIRESETRSPYGMLAIPVVVGVLLLAPLPSFIPAVLLPTMAVFLFLKRHLGHSLSFSYFTVGSLFMGVYIVVLSIPSIFVFSEMGADSKYTYFVAMQTPLITFPLGMVLANFWFPGSSGIVASYASSAAERDRLDPVVRPYFFLLLIAATAVVGYFIAYLPYVPLFGAYGGFDEGLSAVEQRFIADKVPKALEYSYELTRRLILPLLYLYSYYVGYIYKSYFRIVAPLIFCCAMLAASLTLDRSVPFLMIVLLIMTRVCLKGFRFSAVISLRNVGILVVACFIAGAISIYQYQKHEFDWSRAIDTTIYMLCYRILYSPALMASYSFMTFDYDSGFLRGEYVRLFSVLSGRDYIESLDDVAPSFALSPVTFVGDLWRQWGWGGVLVGGMAFGFLYQMIQMLLMSPRSKTAIGLTLFTAFCLSGIWIIFGNAFGIMGMSALAMSLAAALLYCSFAARYTVGRFSARMPWRAGRAPSEVTRRCKLL